MVSHIHTIGISVTDLSILDDHSASGNLNLKKGDMKRGEAERLKKFEEKLAFPLITMDSAVYKILGLGLNLKLEEIQAKGCYQIYQTIIEGDLLVSLESIVPPVMRDQET
ncbi:hypothetical protein TSUD_83810 [Trifolium subterraneum]|uniref:Uncharacterized protein n=1 Tax=Trifolium subterraneum TaxID=3900 RepID=A0A2Z6LYC9_TRISU|nr:hypothetical protein TSUD_83810 [Trifolium subterraneum]